MGESSVTTSQPAGRVELFGLRSEADEIVYLVEGGGSLLGAQDRVHDELVRSVCRLRDDQYVHVIFFSAKCREGPTRHLTRATVNNKRKAVRFIRSSEAVGEYPKVLRAAARAFDILGQTSDAHVKVIFLVAFGTLEEQAAQAFRKLDADGRTRIHTVLLNHRIAAAETQLRRVAAGSGGRFRFVPPED